MHSVSVGSFLPYNMEKENFLSRLDPGLLPQVKLATAIGWRRSKKMRIQIVGSMAISRTVSFRIARTLMLGAKGKRAS